MSNNFEEREEKFSMKRAVAYSFGQFSDIISYQMFTFLIFTFYYAVVGMDVNLITVGFIIWSVWNAFNDPVLGSLSDRTKTKWGRRKPYIIAAIGPLSVIMILLWTPPITTELLQFIYFLIIIILFDFIYTMYSVNMVSVFPEMFQTLNDRTKVNSIRQVFSVIGLIFAFIMPTFFIPELDNPDYLNNYSYAGIFMAIIIAIAALIFIKYGIKERVEFSEDYKTSPSFLNSLKVSMKNKAFTTYIISGLTTWYVFGMLPTIVPLYGSFVLNESDSTILALLLGIAFISSAIFVFLWRFVTNKIGMKKGYMISMSAFIVTLIPFMFIEDVVMGFIAFFLLGIGLSGSLFFRDPIISTIVDADELNTGIRREGGYYGINALIIRFSTIFIFVTIGIVFNSVGWTVFDPLGTTEQTIFGLRSLMFIFPAIALGIGILAMSRFPITKEKYEEIKQECEALHKEKKEKLAQSKI